MSGSRSCWGRAGLALLAALTVAACRGRPRADERLVQAYSAVLQGLRVERRAAEIVLERDLSGLVQELAEQVLEDALENYEALVKPAPRELTLALPEPPGEAVLRDEPALAILRDLDAPLLDRAFANFLRAQSARMLAALERHGETLIPEFAASLEEIGNDTRLHLAHAQRWLDLHPDTGKPAAAAAPGGQGRRPVPSGSGR